MILFLILLLGMVNPAFAQELENKKPWLANTAIDVESYDFDLYVSDLKNKTLSANLKIHFKTLKAAPSVKFHYDAGRIQIQKALLNNNAVEIHSLKGIAGDFHLTGDVLEIVAGDPFLKNQIYTLALTYTLKVSSKDQEGFFFDANYQGSKILSTRNWPYYARMWLPSNDHPSDAASFLITLHVPPNTLAASNGILLEGDYKNGSGLDENGLRVFKWSQKTPIPTYATNIVIGELRVLTAENKNAPAVFFYPPQLKDKEAYVEGFKKSLKSLDWFSLILGKYEYKKYGMVAAPHPFSMESVSLITLIEPAAAVHEAAHHWWGDTVYIKHWGELWISEGFTSYFDGLYDEYLTGEDTSCRQESGFLNNPEDTDPMNVFDDTAYCKGAAALNGLREHIAKLLKKEMKDPVVKNALYEVFRSVYQTYKFKPLGTKELVEHLKENLPITLKKYHSEIKNEVILKSLEEWSTEWFEGF